MVDSTKWWTSADGREYSSPEELDLAHLTNMVPFLEKRAIEACMLGRGDLLGSLLEKRRECILEVRRRSLNIEDDFEIRLNKLFSPVIERDLRELVRLMKV